MVPSSTVPLVASLALVHSGALQGRPTTAWLYFRRFQIAGARVFFGVLRPGGKGGR